MVSDIPNMKYHDILNYFPAISGKKSSGNQDLVVLVGNIDPFLAAAVASDQTEALVALGRHLQTIDLNENV